MKQFGAHARRFSRNLLELLWVPEATLEGHEALQPYMLRHVLAGEVLSQAQVPALPSPYPPPLEEDGDQPTLFA